jgi:hypothetical protein
MFHPPQAAIGLALLPVAWAADERARVEHVGSARREQDEDLSRYFPPGWGRDTLPDWPVTMTSRTVASRTVASRTVASRTAITAHAAQRELGSRLGAFLATCWRGAVRRVRGLAHGSSGG